MSKTTGRLLVLCAVLALGACVREPFPPVYYTVPAPPPLQPYMGPPLAFVAPAPAKRVVRRHYARKRYHRVRCRCTPVQ